MYVKKLYYRQLPFNSTTVEKLYKTRRRQPNWLYFSTRET